MTKAVLRRVFLFFFPPPVCSNVTKRSSLSCSNKEVNFPQKEEKALVYSLLNVSVPQCQDASILTYLEAFE